MQWHGLANGITCPRGRAHGLAHFLFSHEDFLAIDFTQPVTITCEHEDGTDTWEHYYCIRSQAVIPSRETPAHWVTLADRRWVFERIAVNKRYNCRKSKTEWHEDTTNGGTPWTWAQIVTDLWGDLPVSLAGTVPTLAVSPTSTPENLIFEGMSIWQAINQVLTAIGAAVAYQPLSSTWLSVNLNTPWGTLNDFRLANSDRLLWDYHPGDLAALTYPAEVAVTFPGWPGEDDTTMNPFLPVPMVKEVAATVSSSLATTLWPVKDTMFSWTGRDAALETRADEIGVAIEGLLKPLAEPWGQVYSGVVDPEISGSVTEVSWVSDGHRGMRTTVKFSHQEIDWPTVEYGEGGGSGNVIYGDFVAMVVLDEEECPVTQPINAATILITEPPCDDFSLADQEVTVYDPLGCVLDKTAEELDGARVVFSRGTIKNPYFDDAETIPDPEDPEGPEIPNPCYDPIRFLCVYTFIDRCCVEADTGA